MITNSTAIKGDLYQPVPVPSNAAARTTHSNAAVDALPQPAKTQAASPEQVQQAVNQIQQFTQSMARNLNFSVDEETGKTVIKVMDSQTNEIIRQMPSQEAIDIAQALGRIQGTLLNDKA